MSGRELGVRDLAESCQLLEPHWILFQVTRKATGGLEQWRATDLDV